VRRGNNYDKKIKIIEQEVFKGFGRKKLMYIFISMKGGSETLMANNK